MRCVKPPMRLMIARSFADGATLCAGEVLQRIAPLYAGERQCVEAEVEAHLQALKSVGIVCMDAAVVVRDRLVVSYRLTEQGRRRLAWAGGMANT